MDKLTKQSKNVLVGRVVVLDEPTKISGTTYPTKVMQKIKLDNVYGALGDVDSAFAGLDLALISHKFEQLYFQKNGLIGVAKILDTPRGRDLQKLVDAEVPLRFMLKGLVHYEDGKNRVVKSFDLISIDVVAVE